MEDHATVQCPACFEWVEIHVDPYSSGRMVQDCEVCCRPWELLVRRDEDGRPLVEVVALA